MQSQLHEELVVLLPSDLDACPLPQAPCTTAAMEQHAVREDDGHYSVLLRKWERRSRKAKSGADFGARP